MVWLAKLEIGNHLVCIYVGGECCIIFICQAETVVEYFNTIQYAIPQVMRF